MLGSKSGKTASSRRCLAANQGRRRVPGDAVQQVREDGEFPEMLYSKSAKTTSSRRCCTASQGRRRVSGDAVQQVSEDDEFPKMLRIMSTKPAEQTGFSVQPCDSQGKP